MKPTEKSALKVMETLSQRVGLRLQGGMDNRTTGDLMNILADEIDALADAAESQAELVPERLVDLAASCVLVMSSLVAGGEVEITDEQKTETRPIDVESAAEKARQLMIERAAKSNISIHTKID